MKEIGEMGNEEKKIQLQVIVKGLIVLLLASLYAWGGMEYKWLRRFVAPAIFWIGSAIYTKDWKLLFFMPLMFASLSLGYGGDVLNEKIIRRGVFALANGTSSSAYNIKVRNYLLVGVQIVLLVGLYIALGVWNPLPSARAEEFALGFMIFFIPTLSLKRGA